MLLRLIDAIRVGDKEIEIHQRHDPIGRGEDASQHFAAHKADEHAV